MSLMVSRESRFAELLLRGYPPYAAALEIGEDGGSAFAVARDWPNRIEVICAKAELIEKHGEEYFLPSKYDLAREVWNGLKKCEYAEDLARLARLYADIMGHMAPVKTDTKVDNTMQIVVRTVSTLPALKENGSEDVIDVVPYSRG